MDIAKKVPLSAFCLYFCKVLLQPVSLTEAAILLILGLTACYFEFKSNDKKLNLLSEKLDALQKSMDEKNKDIENLKSSVTSFKLASTMRPVSNK